MQPVHEVERAGSAPFPALSVRGLMGEFHPINPFHKL